jgi:hypothetical protein
VAPSTELLTDVVVRQVDKHYIHTDGEWYYPRPESGARADGYKRESRVATLVQDLADRVEGYYGSRVDPNGCPVRILGRLALPAVTLDGRGSFGPLRPDAGCELIRPEPGFQPVLTASGAS